MKRVVLIIFLFFGLLVEASSVAAQTTGQVMFTGFYSDGSDGYSFVALVDIPANTTIYFADNEWDGSAFTAGEGFNSWSHTTSVPAGTVITITNSNNSGSITATLGTAIVDGGSGINLNTNNEALYMYLGTNRTTPTTFLSAISNENFDDGSAVGSISGTGLAIGASAIEFIADQDLMVYTGTTSCTGTVGDCAAQIANTSNWSTDDGTGDNGTDAIFPDFPADLSCGFYGSAFGSITYYSRNATLGGNWDDNNSWTLNSDGSGGPLPANTWPERHDHVVIRGGHTITINAVNDNRICGISPDDLNQLNVGPFVSSNIAMFYQTGDITISGTLTVTGIEMMTGGYTHILSGGTFGLGSNLVQVGYLEADAGSSFSCLDDLVLTGNSVTIINTASTSTDDLVIDHTNATLCGSGTATLQNGAGSQVTYTNGGTINQICTSFTINCTGGGCTGFPVVGTTVVLSGNAGPGGIGNASELSLWLRAGAGTSSTVNGTAISSWNDQSGNTNHASQATVAQRPLYQSAVINGQPTVLFDNASSPNNDELVVADNDNLDDTNGLTIYAVTRMTNMGGDARTIISKRTAVGTNQSYSVFYFTGNNINVDIDGNGNRFTTPSTFSTNNNYIHTVWYNGTATAAQRARVYTNGNLEITATESSATIPNHASDLTIGSINVSDGRPFGGHIGEVFVYRRSLNEAQRIIADNYLSAKYNIAVSNNLYTMDDVGNGNFDFEVAGIGQTSDGSRHLDAKGTGAVRMWNPSGLANNEFLIWGHNGSDFSGGNTSVDGTIIQERLNRIWRVSETGDVGTVSLSVNLAGTLGSALGSNLRLLIDRDGDGFADNDVTPIAGSFSGTTVTFSGVNFQNGDRFTIGNTNISLPLPIELIAFDAEVVQNEVMLNWTTASEQNNDYFTIQRSKTGEEWESITDIKGAGTISELRHYHTSDAFPYPGVSYYRLKQTDYDGKYSYSPIKRVDVAPVFQLKAFPNPTTGKFTITTGFELDRSNVKLLNLLGQEIPISLQNDGNEYSVTPESAVSGVYILQVKKGFWVQSVRILLE